MRSARTVTIAIAPSPRLASFAVICAAIARAEALDSELDVLALGDLYELTAAGAERGVLLVDSDALALEDVGLVKRVVTQRERWRVLLCGDDATRAAAKALLAFDRVRWAPWPLDVVQVRELVRAAAPPSVVVPAAQTARGASTGAFETQVAILADISQRLELAFAAWRESARPDDAEIEGPAAELKRLLRFTRTLSCTVAPPSRGADEFDPAALIDEQLAALALRGRKGPRITTRGANEARNSGLVVRANRAAVAVAIEAVLALALQCAGPNDTVRILYAQQDGELAVTVEFPAGPLAGAAPEQLLDAAFVRQRLPDFGPNEIPAASAILRSQGGEFAIAEGGRGALAVQLRLPHAPAKALARSTSQDPFA